MKSFRVDWITNLKKNNLLHTCNSSGFKHLKCEKADMQYCAEQTNKKVVKHLKISFVCKKNSW